MTRKDGLLSVSVAHCFPWGDVPTCSAYALAITDDNPAQAAQTAEALGQKFFALRHELEMNTLSLDEALDKALSISEHPVVAHQEPEACTGARITYSFVLRMITLAFQQAYVGLIFTHVNVHRPGVGPM